MKKLTFTIILLSTGCAPLTTWVTHPIASITSHTNSVPQQELVSTLTPKGEVVTVTNLVNKDVVTYTTNIVYEAKPAIVSTLATGQAVAAMIPGYGTMVAGGLGALSAFLTFLVRKKNGEASNLTDQLTAFSHGIEQAAATLPPGTGDKIKSHILTAAKLLDVHDDVKDTMHEITK